MVNPIIMDVKKPMDKMLSDNDQDSGIWFLDSKPRDSRVVGPVGNKTKRARL